MGVAFVECDRRDGGELLDAAIEIIVHGIAAQLGKAPATHGVSGAFGWAAVNGGIGEIGGERSPFGIDECARVGEAGGWAVHPAFDPIQAIAWRRIATNVGGQSAVVIVLVESPDENELFMIAQAFGAQGLAFGFGQSRQEHASEDGDNSDNHEELDQGECAAAI